MSAIKGVLFVVVFSLTAIINAQANKKFDLDELGNFEDDPLVEAVYEVGLLSAVMRSLPSNPQLNFEGTLLASEGGFRERVQQAAMLMNFVCAQVYVNHLKDLRVDSSGGVDSTNHYNRNNPKFSSSLLSIASSRGALFGVKLVAEGDVNEILSACDICIKHMDPFLCLEFERSYKRLFDLKDDMADIQNPYYSLFCKIPEPRLETKEGL